MLDLANDPSPPAAAEPFAATLIGSDALSDAPSQAIALAGGRVMTRMDWPEAASAIGRQALRAVLVVEAQGVAGSVLIETLPRIDAVATTLDLQLVVALDRASIDVVAAAILSRNVQLLCSPTMTQRVAALAVAAEAMSALPFQHDSWREGEAGRLQRLNEEVARIADVLARLTRREALEPPSHAEAVADRRAAFGHEPSEDEAQVDAAEVRRAIRARRLRDSFFGTGLFEDPAWDMLLDLFAAELERTQVSVSSLCIAAAVAPTTALRWIGKLTDAGLFERQPDPFDRRRAFMALTERASQGMRAYVSSLQRAGLHIA